MTAENIRVNGPPDADNVFNAEKSANPRSNGLPHPGVHCHVGKGDG